MAKSLFLVKNVDDCIDRFYDQNLDMKNGFSELFPRATKDRSIQETNFGHVFNYVTAKMAAVTHPDAKGFVYAFHFKLKDQKVPISSNEFDEEDEYDSLDKIGMGKDPRTRMNKSFYETPIPNLKYHHTLALFPTARYGGAKALEEAVLNSMHPEDHKIGEWFYGTIGVWKTLIRWHVACFSKH